MMIEDDVATRAKEYYAKFNEMRQYAEKNQSLWAWAEFLSIIDPSMHGCADMLGFQNKAIAALLRNQRWL